MGRSERKIAVFIFDPRLFREFIIKARRLSLGFEVPNDLNMSCEDTLLIVDLQAVEEFGNSRAIRECGHVIITHENIDKILLYLLGKDYVNRLIIGIDPGRRFSYAVFADDILVEAGHSSNVDDLSSVVDKVMKSYMAGETVVRIGLPSKDDILAKVLDIALKLASKGLNVYLVEEQHSSTKPLYEFRGLKMSELDEDIYAAINIAFREGIKVESKEGSS